MSLTSGWSGLARGEVINNLMWQAPLFNCCDKFVAYLSTTTGALVGVIFVPRIINKHITKSLLYTPISYFVYSRILELNVVNVAVQHSQTLCGKVSSG